MKILHVVDSGGLYGAEVMLLSLIDEQIKLGLDPTIASIGEKHIKEKPIETEALKKGFKVKKFRMFPGPNIAGALKVLKYAERNGFDLLHSHGYKGNVAFGFMPRKFRKIPLVSTAHGWTSTKGLTKNRIYEWLDTLSFKFIDAVVLVSNTMKSHPRLKSLNGNNIHVIPNGIPIPDSTVTQFNDSTTHPFNQSPIQFNNSTNQPFDKEIEAFCSKGFTIGSIGRLSTEKGYKHLVGALGILIKEGIDARLVIIGEGYQRYYLEGLVDELGLSGRVMLPGYRDNAKQYIPRFNAFAISSLTEGLPITLLEAMQAKVPIVATDVGGIPEVLQNGTAGVLVQSSDSNEFAEALARLYHHAQWARELTNIAYKTAVTDFSSQKMAEQYLDIYQAVREGKRPRGLNSKKPMFPNNSSNSGNLIEIINSDAVNIDLISENTSFFSLATEWDSLWEKSMCQSIFLSHGWLSSWWEAYGKGKQLLALLAYQGQRLLGAAPLMRYNSKHRGIPVRVVSFIENDESPHSGFVVDHEANISALVSTFMSYTTAHSGRWDILLLRKIPDGSEIVGPIKSFCKKNGYAYVVRPSLQSPILRVKSDWETFYSGTTQRFKKRMRYGINKLKREGNFSIQEMHTPGEVEAVLTDIFQVGALSWKGEEGKSISNMPETRSFFARLPRALQPKAAVSLWSLRLKDKMVAFEYHIKHEDIVCALRGEFDNTYRSCGPGSVLDFEVVRSLFQDGTRLYDMCGSADEYKLRWTSEVQPHVDILIFSRQPRGMFLAFLEKHIRPVCKQLLQYIRMILSGKTERQQS